MDAIRARRHSGAARGSDTSHTDSAPVIPLAPVAGSNVGMPAQDTGEAGVSWLATSRADYDAALAARGHKRGPEQAGLFYVPTPERDRKAGRGRELISGEVPLFGDEGS